MNLTPIEKKFESSAKIHGGVFLLEAVDAIHFVGLCEQEGVDILGVEGFRAIGDRIQPLQDHSFDLERDLERNHGFARDFLEKRIGQNLWFEVVTSDR